MSAERWGRVGPQHRAPTCKSVKDNDQQIFKTTKPQNKDRSSGEPINQISYTSIHQIMADKTIVVVTGANTGLGYEIVRSLCGSDHAYHILLGGRSVEKARNASEDANTEFPNTQSSIQAVQIDIEDDASIDALFKDVESRYGRVDVLVNNAGTSVPIPHSFLDTYRYRRPI